MQVGSETVRIDDRRPERVNLPRRLLGAATEGSFAGPFAFADRRAAENALAKAERLKQTNGLQSVGYVSSMMDRMP